MRVSCCQKAAPVEVLLLGVLAQHAVWTRCAQMVVAEVIAGGTPQQQKAVMNTLFEGIEQRDEQIERYVAQPWARELL
jgi:hypothetical protein